MTEAEWLTWDDPRGMLAMLRDRASNRKLRLYACACCRRLDRLMSDPRNQEHLAVAERAADGGVTAAELAQKSRARPWFNDPVGCALLPDPFVAADGTQYYAAKAVRKEVGNDEVNTAWVRERAAQADLLRDLFCYPFHPRTFEAAWLTTAAVRLAAGIYRERAFDRLPILADALEDAGCDDRAVLDHCRGPGPHVRGCWVVDLILGKQ